MNSSLSQTFEITILFSEYKQQNQKTYQCLETRRKVNVEGPDLNES